MCRLLWVRVLVEGDGGLGAGSPVGKGRRCGGPMTTFFQLNLYQCQISQGIPSMHQRVGGVQRSSAGLQHFLGEPGADAMSHQEHARLGSVMRRADHRGTQGAPVPAQVGSRKRHRGTSDRGRERKAQVRVGEDDDLEELASV